VPRCAGALAYAHASTSKNRGAAETAEFVRRERAAPRYSPSRRIAPLSMRVCAYSIVDDR
jgi:hypothetical protein